MKKILFLFPYPSGTAASQRFRFEQYLDFLNKNGFSFHLQSFLDDKTWSVLYKPGYTFQKIIGILKGFLRRFYVLFSLGKYDFVFLHREASPLGPPIFEFLIAKVFRKKIIFDFDDAIWLPNTSQENKIARLLKFHSKIKLICQWSYKISAGNDYLANWAATQRKSLTNVIVNPTTLDTQNLHNKIKQQNTQNLVIGWTGTHSTLIYLDELLPVIRKLEQQYSFTFLVISDKNPAFDLKSFQYLPWKKETERDDLLKMNVGVMPLTDDDWAKGKCGFKALQYMALGIPALVSPVGVNTKIVKHLENGFICQTAEEWEKALLYLLQNPNEREKLGREARLTVEENYSVVSNQSNFLHLFD
jgi:glycosyltransferase involved in cell wall biosynthesis